MKVPKCTKTVTGKHEWIDGRYEALRQVKRDNLEVYIAGYISCKYCGIIDDRKK